MIKNSRVKIVNLTDVEIKLYPLTYTDIKIPVSKENEAKVKARCIIFPKEGCVTAQLSAELEPIEFISGTTTYKVNLAYTHVGIVTNLPEEKDGVIYIVSQLAYNAIHHIRKDVYTIDKPVRTTYGAVLACRGFSRCVYDESDKVLAPVSKYLSKKMQSLSSSDIEEAKQIMELLKLINRYTEK
jgi:hypothetical protein